MDPYPFIFYLYFTISKQAPLFPSRLSYNYSSTQPFGSASSHETSSAGQGHHPLAQSGPHVRPRAGAGAGAGEGAGEKDKNKNKEKGNRVTYGRRRVLEVVLLEKKKEGSHQCKRNGIIQRVCFNLLSCLSFPSMGGKEWKGKYLQVGYLRKSDDVWKILITNWRQLWMALSSTKDWREKQEIRWR